MKALLKELTGTPGPAGHEEAVRALIRREVEPLADELRVDALGSLVARKRSLSKGQGGLRILVASRMDEPGLIASHIDAQGRVRFAALGPLERHSLAGSLVRFLNGQAGVVGCEAGAEALPALDRFFVDVGSDRAADCPVKPGETAVLEVPFQELGGRVSAGALETRAGVAAAIETLRGLKSSPHELCFVFAAQGQVSANTLAAAAYALEPEIAITLEAAAAGEGIRLGGGPAVKMRAGYLLADPRLVEWMTAEAERRRLPFQRELGRAGGENGIGVQSRGEGVPWSGLSIPVRYLHSPSEMLDLQDLDGMVRLLTALLRRPLRLGS